MEHHEGLDRVVMIGPKAQEILRPWLKSDLEAFLFSPADALDQWNAERRQQYARERRERGGKLYPSQKRRIADKRAERPSRAPRDHYDVASYRRAIHRGCDAAFPHPDLTAIPEKDLNDAQCAELESWRKAHRWSPNRLRHSAATRVRRELGIEAARALLGHSDADTTTIYAERDLELARTAMERMG
jgi:Phage integrase family